jgi:integrase
LDPWWGRAAAQWIGSAGGMVLDYRLNCNRLLPGQRGDQQLLPPPEPVAHRSPPTPGLQVRQDRTRTRSLGRRIHDPRHAAACLWLTVEVHVVIVQAWMGPASIATTNLYLHPPRNLR